MFKCKCELIKYDENYPDSCILKIKKNWVACFLDDEVKDYIADNGFEVGKHYDCELSIATSFKQGRAPFTYVSIKSIS